MTPFYIYLINSSSRFFVDAFEYPTDNYVIDK